MSQYRYAGYPDAKVFDDDGNQIQHLIWGDWVRVDGPEAEGWVPVRVRGVTGWMREGDLQHERLLEIVFVDVGQGDGCLVVTPDDRHVLIDAGVDDHMFRFLRWRYAGFKRKWTFDSAIITHPDSDHYQGFSSLFEHENVYFKALYHNGIMEQRGDPLGRIETVRSQKYLTDLMETRGDLAAFLSDSERWKRKWYPSLLNSLHQTTRVDDIRMLSTAHSESGFLPGFGLGEELKIEVLGPVPESHDGRARLRAFGSKPGSRAFNKGVTKNGHSVVLMLRYRNLRVLLGGDLNRPAESYLLQHYSGLDHRYPWTAEQEAEIVAAARPTFECDIAKSCHHGSLDVTDAMLRSIHATATVVSSGDEESHAHPRPETLGALGRFGRGSRPLIYSTELMRSTREGESDARERLAELRTRVSESTDAAERREADEALDAFVDRLAKRNVTVYGAINLRSDGRKALMAYRLEKDRHGRSRAGRTLSRWDLARFEPAGAGALRPIRS